MARWGQVKATRGTQIDPRHPFAQGLLYACLFEGYGASTGITPGIIARGIAPPVTATLGVNPITWSANAEGDCAVLAATTAFKIPAGSSSLPLTGITILAIRRYQSTPLDANGNTHITGSGIQVFCPYSDGVTYWDFGGASAPNRLTVSGLSFGGTRPDRWVFTAGAAGSSIWQNGIKVATQATALTRSSGSADIILGGPTGGDSPIEWNFFQILDYQWTDDLCRQWSAQPYAHLYSGGLSFPQRTSGPFTLPIFAESPATPVTGTGSLTAPTGLEAGTGTLAISGTATLTALVGLESGSGSAIVSGTATLTAPVGLEAGTGTESIPGTASLTAPHGLMAGVGTEIIYGAGGMTEPAGRMAATGTTHNSLSTAGCVVDFPVIIVPVPPPTPPPPPAMNVVGVGGLIAPLGQLAGNPMATTLVIPSTGTLYLPPGIYDITTPISWADRPVCVYGDAADLTIIRQLTPGLPVFQGNYSGFYKGSPDIHDLTLLTTVQNSAAAIQVTYPTEPLSSIAQICGKYRNLTIQADQLSLGSQGWKMGLDLISPWSAIIEHLIINGNVGGTIVSGSRGVRLSGVGSAGTLHNNVQVNSMEVGFEAKDRNQGLVYTACQAVRGTTGYWMNMDSAHPQPLVTMIGCHANTDANGVILAYMDQWVIIGLELYKGAAVNYIGVDVQHGAIGRLLGTSIANNVGGGTSIGVKVATLGNTIVGVSGQGLDSVVNFTAASQDNRWNSITGSGNTALVVNAGTNNTQG